jgi:hypothetical protein
MDIALKTLEYLTEETEYVPWVAAGDQLGYIHKMIAETELYGAFEVSCIIATVKLFGTIPMSMSVFKPYFDINLL